MKKIVFYYKNGIINDATSFYIDVIENAAKKINVEFVKTMNLMDIKKDDIVLTICCKHYIKVLLTHPFNKTIFWSQGIEPEESRLHCNIIKYWIKSIMEYVAIKYSTLLFMVSDAMYEHYRKKYGIERKHYIIMPCFNAEKLLEVELKKYNQPTFVFAGGTSRWHCAEQIVDTYKRIEETLPNASIKILSNAKDWESILQKYKVKNYSISYVSLEQLPKELSFYKYGFLLRESHVINKVATPTKMSSYLGSGLIPVYTDAVEDFCKKIDLGEFSLLFKTPIDTKEIADSIIRFEQQLHDYNKYKSIVNDIFKNYYCTSNYINIIIEELEDILK